MLNFPPYRYHNNRLGLQIMTDQRRSETPTSDRIVQREISISVILQGLILAAIIGSVTVLLDIKDSLSELSAAQRVTNVELNAVKQALADLRVDHESRLRALENSK